MTTRSRLEQIEDYHFAVDKFIHKGETKEDVELQLKNRGMEEGAILGLFIQIEDTYKGPRLIEKGKTIRALNLLIDSAFILFLWIAIMNTISSESWMKFNDLIIFILPALYFILTEFILGRTLGKFITGSRVITGEGKLPNIMQVIIRTLFRYFPYTPLTVFIGDRILHDKLSGTFVVDNKRWKNKFGMAAVSGKK